MRCGLRLRTAGAGCARLVQVRARCLALAVVEMLLVGGDDLSGRDEVGIDEDMEVSGAFVHFAGGLDHEAGGRHHYLKW